jgi:hypothetical protein
MNKAHHTRMSKEPGTPVTPIVKRGREKTRVLKRKTVDRAEEEEGSIFDRVNRRRG